jgi:predicted flap endonuclease-1-like 5' DNA nuclease
VTFSLPTAAAQGGHDVRLVGEFNGWQWQDGYPLEPSPEGFSAEVNLGTGRDYQFRFLIDNRVWENHWNADAYVPTPFGVDNSVVSLRGAEPTRNAASPELSTAPPPGADDLTLIEGIGPKISQLLEAAGVATYAALAAAERVTLVDILAAGGPRYQMHDPTSWPEQAALIAAGEWDTLKALQDRLVAGRA